MMRAVRENTHRRGASARSRLCDTHGFTLAEQLVSILFLGLLCVVIGVGLNAALQAYRVANESTRANELLARAVEEVSDELAFARSVDVSGSDPVYVSSVTKTPVQLGNDPNGRGIILAPAAIDGVGSDTQEAQILVASSHGLVVEISDVAFIDNQGDNDKRNTWNYRIEVKRDGDQAVVAETRMAVAWIG